MRIFEACLDAESIVDLQGCQPYPQWKHSITQFVIHCLDCRPYIPATASDALGNNWERGDPNKKGERKNLFTSLDNILLIEVVN